MAQVYKGGGSGNIPKPAKGKLPTNNRTGQNQTGVGNKLPPGHPSHNPTHIHGPAAMGKILGATKPTPGSGAPKKGGGSGKVAGRAPKGLPGRTIGGGGRL